MSLKTKILINETWRSTFHTVGTQVHSIGLQILKQIILLVIEILIFL